MELESHRQASHRQTSHRQARLSLPKIQAALATNGAELGVLKQFERLQPQFDIHIFDQLTSTSAQLWSMLEAGAGSGTVAIAHQQSAGRGQRGRIWRSEPGGLYLSLALEPDWPVAHSAQLTCLSAWGIAIAFNNLGIPLKVKWPNDLFFEGKKLGGILTETKLAHSTASSLVGENQAKPLPCIKQAVIGVGINWHNPVPETGITLQKILEGNPNLYAKTKINCLEMLAALVLKGILQGVFFQQQVGSQVFMKVYERLLTQVGKTVSVDNDLLKLATPASVAHTAHVLRMKEGQFGNHSGEVLGVSEEGYLRVAVQRGAFEPWSEAPSEHVVLLKPTETLFVGEAVDRVD
ncbi:MAG: biotin--[acetyl-CoA-carboxylase] ligase [Cyanobacteria bacterium J06597_16]